MCDHGTVLSLTDIILFAKWPPSSLKRLRKGQAVPSPIARLGHLIIWTDLWLNCLPTQEIVSTYTDDVTRLSTRSKRT